MTVRRDDADRGGATTLNELEPLGVAGRPESDSYAAAEAYWATLGDPPPVFAGFFRRAAALVIDGALLLIAWTAGVYAAGAVVDRMLAGVVDTRDPVVGGLLALALFLFLLGLVGLYHAAMESSSAGATLGKLALGLRVTDARGGRVSFVRASCRFVAKLAGGVLVFVFLIGVFDFLTVVWDDERRAVHDMLAGTRVVRAY